jgi:hypothetical protein
MFAWLVLSSTHLAVIISALLKRLSVGALLATIARYHWERGLMEFPPLERVIISIASSQQFHLALHF